MLSISFHSYSQQAHDFAVYPKEKALEYCTLGLVGEAGEFADKVKKILRGDTNFESVQGALQKELGDVLWYLNELSLILDIPLQNLAQQNIDKLSSRANRGVLKGSGDER